MGQRNAACAQADRARHRDKHKPCGCSTCSAAGTRPPPPRCSPSHPRRRHTHRPNAQVTSSDEMQIICTVPGAGQDGSRAAGTPRTNQPHAPRCKAPCAPHLACPHACQTSAPARIHPSTRWLRGRMAASAAPARQACTQRPAGAHLALVNSENCRHSDSSRGVSC